ncbi:MAG: AmmeMemoRadiSam system protein B [Parcubacteria group bacterium CG23_combo_of_CG06-09_8_20_14_all_35_9]|nr:MAG: AmmeMemoRadiSam system protein B [Parcubacteria group bacterium CG23_combo_of_CG06-09_8_20_14_all_35_9]
MPLVFSSICPHPPILIPNIGKENIDQIQKTVEAMQELEEDLYIAKPETILIISPHGTILPHSFNVNLETEYKSNLEQFGDFTTKLKFKSDIPFINEIKAKLETKIPLILISGAEIDHGATVPLYYLTQHLPQTSIIPMGYSLLDYKSHFEFGKELKKIIIESKRRIAVIASGDLSHRLTKDAPAGYSPRGKEFDKKLIKLLKAKNAKGILNLNPALIEEAGECGLRSIVILLGILDDINYIPKVLSYEAPFGVGYLVVNFELSL